MSQKSLSTIENIRTQRFIDFASATKASGLVEPREGQVLVGLARAVRAFLAATDSDLALLTLGKVREYRQEVVAPAEVRQGIDRHVKAITAAIEGGR